VTNTAELTIVRLQPHELEASLRFLPAITDAVNQLIYPRLVHTEIHNDAGGIDRIHTEEHPALVDLLEHGTGSSNRGRSAGIRIPIDAEALELWAQIRDQVRLWLRALGATWTDDLKHDLNTWHTHHEDAVHRGNVTPAAHTIIARRLDAWVDRIDAKYDPDEKREWTSPCPALIPIVDADGNDTDELRRCGARKVLIDGELKSAIDLNVTRLTARCRRCRTTWEGERGLKQLRWETNHYDDERQSTRADQ